MLMKIPSDNCSKGVLGLVVNERRLSYSSCSANPISGA